MTQVVKDFVEENIDIIETKQWKAVFNCWYNNGIPVNCSTETLFKEFYKLLMDLSLVKSYEDTEKERKEVIQSGIDRILAYFFTIAEKNLHIGTIEGNLYSYLGFSDEQIMNMIIEYVSQMYEYNSDTKRFLLE